ncbi:MAG: hypothetical protein HOO98_08885 [Nitrospira sp.]|nr:hypothetical protein [Nitrospira sp.]
MLQLQRRIAACILATVLLPTVAVQAATYYVATTGNDSNNGTSENTPFATPRKGIEILQAGDTVLIKNGTYNITNYIWLTRGGSASAPIKIMAYPGHVPVLNFLDTTDNRKYYRLLLQRTPGHNLPIGYVTVEGLTFTNGVNAIRWYNCDHCTIRRNRIVAPYGSGILGTGGLDNLIDRNVIENAGDTSDHGLYLTGSRYVITNNLIYGSEKYGIQLNGTANPNDTRNYAGPEFAKTENVIITNNVVAYNRTAAAIVIWGPWVNNARIENNIFYQNGLDAGTFNGINWVACCSTGVQIRNNISYATEPRSTVFMSSRPTENVHYTQSGNMVNTVDPGFVNAPAIMPALPNFKLKERSSAIDQGLLPERSPGLPLATTRIDFNGTTRPQGRAYDIGAYEYSAGNDSESPAAPILQVR